ncbi:hypothetical protein GE061_007342 [Apolygus lucorum]|uniref:Rho-GAP domain-containing protein n=1 Tax=Apolygus lucorum TaxID=248454 RepID=A0A8S9WU15_APOLU|nr:hypothetical protein GE061_007342 [Apolygus lucorum]
MGKPSPSGKKKKERWLLTRKTWRYMADAGRRLIPEGSSHGREDIPKIEAYFQEVCTKEPKFLLWRKQSYPGAIGFRRNRGRRKGKGGSCRDKTSSADEAEDLRDAASGSSSGAGTSIGTSRTDLRRLREEFLFGKQLQIPFDEPSTSSQAREDELMGTLQHYLYGGSSHTLDTDALFDKLKQHLAEITSKRQPVTVSEDCQVLEVLRRYYSRSTNRDKVISDILTDRKKLEGLYFDLRKARGFQVRSRWTTYRTAPRERSGSDWENVEEETTTGEESTVPSSPVVVEPDPVTTLGTQTRLIPSSAWETIEEEVKKLKIKEAEVEKEAAKSGGGPRRSSVDNDDVSPSVSDTIKRYLRMARKKSVDSDKVDRFRRVNYDRNLRNIKGKGEPPISEDDGNDRGCQTDETWIEALRDLKIETVEYVDSPSSRSSFTEETMSPTSPTSPTSKSLLSSGQSFLTSLLHGLQQDKHHHVPPGAGAMQKSKSSTSVVQQGSRLVARIRNSRSKSSSRVTSSATSAWTPQGRCAWTNVAGRSVTLLDTTLDQLSEIERRILQKVALAKLQALNLGVAIKLPQEPTAEVPQKPKRKAYLLKRKAQTVGLFDTSRSKDDKGRCENRTGGVVFGIPLGLCVEKERASRERSTEASSANRKMGARGSFSSLIEAPLTDDKGSIESLMSPTLSMPGLDDISLEGGSESNLSQPPSTGVPNLVSACLNHLQSHLNTLGIFRVSSSKKRVRQLREEFDLGKELRLEDEQCPHDVATLLKEYFRDLPDPLLCKDLYHAFIQTQRIRNRRLQHEAMQHLLQLLPVANRDTLLSLLTFLALVASHCDDHKDPDSGEWVSGNRMDSTNLATLFAPNILHSATPNRGKDELSQERMDERSDAINVIRSLIDNFQTLYMVSAELLDEVYVHMMDTHPEALDQLLRRKEATAIDVDSTEEERKFWSREEMTHESAATGGPEMALRPRRTDRGRERLSKKRRDEIAKKRNESRERRAESGSGDSRRPSDERTFSSSDSGRLSPQTIQSEGVITASLKIPVPHVTSLLQNLDDIPFIEDGDRHHITLGMVKGHQGPDSGTSESGLGSTSPPQAISPVTSPPPEAWESGSSTTTESPSRKYQTQRYTRLEGSSHSYNRLQTERLTKSSSSTAVVSHISPIPTSISSIGSDVLRSKTADIERMIRSSASSATSSSKISMVSTSMSSVGSGVLRSKTADIERMIRSSFYSSSSSQGSSWSSSQRATSGASVESKRRLTESSTRALTDAPSTRPVGVWKRRELIASQPKSPL